MMQNYSLSRQTNGFGALGCKRPSSCETLHAREGGTVGSKKLYNFCRKSLVSETGIRDGDTFKAFMSCCIHRRSEELVLAGRF